MKVFLEALIKFLKDKLVVLALKKLLGTAAMGGFKAWLIKFIVTELYEHIGEPLLRLAARKGMLHYDKAVGAIRVKKYEDAIKTGDIDKYADNIGRV